MTLRSVYELAAPAKLNAFLHIIGRREDGYHMLQSVFVLIDWCDTLHFELRHDGQLLRHDLGDALPADDLCLRAARLLQQQCACSLGADILIDKRIPSGAGMGGGSSDAATTLLALNRLWHLNWPRQRLLALALRLGADVPFFVGGRNAFVQGIGEQLSAIAWPEQHYLVVKPPIAISTQAIFSDSKLVRDTEAVIVQGSFEDRQHELEVPAEWPEGFGQNDLEPVATSRFTEVAQAAKWLSDRYGNSRMTGSGSAVFARVGAGVLPGATWPQEELPAAWVGRHCRSLPAHPLVRWAD